MKNKVNSKFFFWGISAVLFAIVLYKSIVLSMTHDESASFFYLNDKNVLGYLFKSDVWPNANNHWLNTLSFQFFTSMFGPEEWAIRLGNVLSFIPYLYFSYLLLQKVDSKWLQILGFLLLTANPYFLDFFSMARGYGMSTSFFMGGFYWATRYASTEKLKFLGYSILFFLLASVSLFSALIFYPAVIGALILYLLQSNYPNIAAKEVWKPLLVSILGGLILLAFTLTPIMALSGNAEFEWGAPTLLECFKSFTFHTMYGKPYRPNELFFVGLCTAGLAMLIYKCLPFLKADLKHKHIELYLAILSFSLLLVLMILARKVTGTFYPIERKTIIFIPFLSLIFTYGLDRINLKHKNILAMIGIGVISLHLCLSFKSDEVREWWYDRDTKDFIAQIAEDAEERQVTIGCHWFFHPTLSFYAKTQYSNRIKIMNYNKNIDTESPYDYYMCFDSDVKRLESDYEVYFRNPAGRVILKRLNQ